MNTTTQLLEDQCAKYKVLIKHLISQQKEKSQPQDNDDDAESRRRQELEWKEMLETREENMELRSRMERDKLVFSNLSKHSRETIEKLKLDQMQWTSELGSLRATTLRQATELRVLKSLQNEREQKLTNEMQAKIESILQQLELKEENLQSLQSQLNESTTASLELNAQYNTISSQLENTKSDLLTSNNHNTVLKFQISELTGAHETEVRNLKTDFEEKTTEFNAKLDHQQKIQNELSKTISLVEEEKQRIEEQNSNLKNELHQTQLQVEHLRQNFENHTVRSKRISNLTRAFNYWKNIMLHERLEASRQEVNEKIKVAVQGANDAVLVKTAELEDLNRAVENTRAAHELELQRYHVQLQLLNSPRKKNSRFFSAPASSTESSPESSPLPVVPSTVVVVEAAVETESAKEEIVTTIPPAEKLVVTMPESNDTLRLWISLSNWKDYHMRNVITKLTNALDSGSKSSVNRWKRWRPIVITSPSNQEDESYEDSSCLISKMLN